MNKDQVAYNRITVKSSVEWEQVPRHIHIEGKPVANRSRHHIIGQKLIRDNLVQSIIGVLSTSTDSQEKQLLVEYLKKWVAIVIDRIDPPSGEYKKEVNQWNGDQIYKALIWNPGNLFIGVLANNRLDDPAKTPNINCAWRLINRPHQQALWNFYSSLVVSLGNNLVASLKAYMQLLDYPKLVGVWEENKIVAISSWNGPNKRRRPEEEESEDLRNCKRIKKEEESLR